MAKEGESQLLLDRVLMGVVGGFAALLFAWMLRVSDKFFLGWMAGHQAPRLPGEGGALQQVIGPHGLWLVVPVIVVGGLNVMSLLRSGIPVDLPGGKRIVGYQLREESSYVGKPVHECTNETGEDNLEIVVLVRDRDVLLPNPESVFKPGDQMLAIVTVGGRKWLEKHFIPMTPQGISGQIS